MYSTQFMYVHICTWCFTHCRPQFMTLYFNEPDHSGHEAGPDSALVSVVPLKCIHPCSMWMLCICVSICVCNELQWTELKVGRTTRALHMLQTALRSKCQVSFWLATLGVSRTVNITCTFMWHVASFSTSLESSLLLMVYFSSQAPHIRRLHAGIVMMLSDFCYKN